MKANAWAEDEITDPRPRVRFGAPTLRLLQPGAKIRTFPIAGSLVIGRAPGVQVRLDDPDAARFHAELSRTKGGVLIRSLDRRCTTWVDGRPLTEPIMLKPGSRLKIGSVDMQFEGELIDAPARRESKSHLRVGHLQWMGWGALVVVAACSLVAWATFRQSAPALSPRPGTVRLASTELLDALRRCRTESNEGHWHDAEAACLDALDLDPKNQQAHAEIQRIHVAESSGDTR